MKVLKSFKNLGINILDIGNNNIEIPPTLNISIKLALQYLSGEDFQYRNDVEHEAPPEACLRYKFLSLKYYARVLFKKELNLESLCRHLSNMTNLITFEVDYNIVSSFQTLCGSLTNNLKNMQVINAGKMTMEDLISLSESCPNIKNLSLRDITCSEITFKSVMNLFRNLNGLLLKCSKGYDSNQILIDLEKRNGNVGLGRIDWPDINVLVLSAKKFKENEKRALERLIRGTARKPGQIERETLGLSSGRDTTNIILQKKSGASDIFGTLFNCTEIGIEMYE
uniref:F-box domain-containing protein n=1 Tax=Parastrongyloides trichosuri TaxID=131310 RepID=A0A0N4ZB45_PARTI